MAYLYKDGTVSTSSRNDSGIPVTDVSVKGSASLVGKVKNVTTAGTRTALDNVPCNEVTVIAKKSNKGSIFVGGADVTSSVYGVELAPDQSFTFVVRNANLIHIDAATSGDGVSYVSI